MVGFHDILCLWILGYKGILKLSSKDNVLIPFLTNYLEEKSKVKSFIYKDSIFKNFDAVIATGSNNTSIYFNYYFSKYPNIIRKNRTSIAILDGNETEIELKNLAKDILLYYGLGCRNVSKIYIPKELIVTNNTYSKIKILNYKELKKNDIIGGYPFCDKLSKIFKL